MRSFEHRTSTETAAYPAVAPTPVEASFVVEAMQRLTQEFGKTLANGTSAAYKAKSLNDKSDDACMGWAINPETRYKSIELKGLHMSKLVLRAALNTGLTEPNNRYLPLVDYAYWHGVDAHVYNNISRYIDENAEWGKLLRDVPYDDLPNGVFARINDNVVHRSVSYRPDGQQNIAVYAVYPVDYPVQIAGPVIL